MTQFKATPPMTLPHGQASDGQMDNVIDRTTTGANSGGFSNEPAFPNNNAVNPLGQGDSGAWAGIGEAAPPDSSDTPQFYDIGDDMGLGDPTASLTLPEQNFAKPTDSPKPNALGPGMTQG